MATPTPSDPMHRWARFDRTKRYRYRLGRTWEACAPSVLFVLLNPSAADAEVDDPTLRRCLGFARRWGFGRLEIANLFGWRARHPRELRRAPDPVGPRTDRHLRAALRDADAVLVGWGNGGRLQGRAQEVTRGCLRGVAAWCLGTTRRDEPRHPLYVPSATRPVPWVRYAPAPRRSACPLDPSLRTPTARRWWRRAATSTATRS